MVVGGLTGDHLSHRQERDRLAATCHNRVNRIEFGEDKRYKEHRRCDFIYRKFKSGKKNPKW